GRAASSPGCIPGWPPGTAICCTAATWAAAVWPTDGVTEARDAHGAFFPLAGAVAEAVAADPGVAQPGRLVDFVRESTLRHSGGHLGDDTTVFAVRRIPPEGNEPPGDGRSPP
ncbi:SpoIIE family protein phosphatase, partial [Streptomyces nigra]